MTNRGNYPSPLRYGPLDLPKVPSGPAPGADSAPSIEVLHTEAEAWLWRERTDRAISRAEVAEAEVERLHSWPGLLSLLDEHWPEGAFPSLIDDAERDTGPRLISALRRVEKAAATIARVEALADDLDGESSWDVDGPAVAADIRAALRGPSPGE